MHEAMIRTPTTAPMMMYLWLEIGVKPLLGFAEEEADEVEEVVKVGLVVAVGLVEPPVMPAVAVDAAAPDVAVFWAV